MKQKRKLIDLLPKHRMIIDPSKHFMAHPTYKLSEIEEINITHRVAENFHDKLALYTVRGFRKIFDMLTGYHETRNDVRLWINRAIFLETIAGVPGMVGGMTIHLKSLRTLKPDRGIIH